MNHDFPTIEEVVAIHDEAVYEFGGSLGLRDMGALASAVMRPQIGYYDTLIEEAAALMESLAMNHPFIDRQQANGLLYHRRLPAQERQLH